MIPSGVRPTADLGLYVLGHAYSSGTTAYLPSAKERPCHAARSALVWFGQRAAWVAGRSRTAEHRVLRCGGGRDDSDDLYRRLGYGASLDGSMSQCKLSYVLSAGRTRVLPVRGTLTRIEQMYNPGCTSGPRCPLRRRPVVTPMVLVGSAPKEAYVGDPETKLVHRHHFGCPGKVGVFFLVLQTARMYGYHCCPYCFAEEQAPIS